MEEKYVYLNEMSNPPKPYTYTPDKKRGVLLTGTNKRSIQAQRLVEIYGDICCYCSCVLNDEIRTIEHIIPVSKGGGNRFENLLLCCTRHNNMRGNTEYEIFLAWVVEHPNGSAAEYWRYYRYYRNY